MSATLLREIRVTLTDEDDAKKFERIKQELGLDQNATVIRVLIRKYKLEPAKQQELTN